MQAGEAQREGKMSREVPGCPGLSQSCSSSYFFRRKQRLARLMYLECS